ncbi:hypothetical protein FJY71_09690, partial [candidate division WOR-3 bacterium]|nr:hypothetical protein [candidate division WOR-3 bacterium]
MRQLVLLLGLAALAVCQPALNPLDPQSGSFLEFPLDSTQRAARRAYNAGRCEEAALLYLQALAHDI